MCSWCPIDEGIINSSLYKRHREASGLLEDTQPVGGGVVVTVGLKPRPLPLLRGTC